MKPLDAKLLKYAKSARLNIALTSGSGVLQAILIIAQVFFISKVISPIIAEGKTWSDVYQDALWLALIGLLRVGLIWWRNAHQLRSAKQAIRELRQGVLTHSLKLGPRWQAQKGADTVTLVTRGLDALEPYFVDYLPQLFLTVTVTPLTVIVLAFTDLTSAIVAFITIPLIPIFMIIIGITTRDASARRLKTMQQLGRQLLDLIAGLSTLKILGRHQGPEKQLRKIGDAYTRTTMGTLRIAFLSGAVLEFIGTLSVAIVAVTVGLRMVSGQVDLETGLIAIMLAPEIYNPLREVGKHFHASADGVAAAQSAFEILETPLPATGKLMAPDLQQTTIQVEELSVSSRGTWAPEKLSFQIFPKQLTVLIGPSGSGKTTTVMCLLKQLSATKGKIRLLPAASSSNHTPVDLAEIASDSWWEQITWLPQQPTLLPGTLAENLVPDTEGLSRLFPNNAPSQRLMQAAELSGFAPVVEQLKDGWFTNLGQGGLGLSVGQRQRLALLRALLSVRQLIILDEPSAHLDAHLSIQVTKVVEHLKSEGKTIIVIAHRPEILSLADQVINVTSQPMEDSEKQQFAALLPLPAYSEEAIDPGFLGENLDSSPVKDSF